MSPEDQDIEIPGDEITEKRCLICGDELLVDNHGGMCETCYVLEVNLDNFQ